MLCFTGSVWYRLPIPTFIFSAASSSPSTIPSTTEAQPLKITNTEEDTGPNLSDLRELFSKILSADVLHFKTTPSVDVDAPWTADDKDRTLPIPSSVAPLTSVGLPALKDDHYSLPLVPDSSSDNSTHLLYLLRTPGGISFVLSLIACFLAIGMFLSPTALYGGNYQLHLIESMYNDVLPFSYIGRPNSGVLPGPELNLQRQCQLLFIAIGV